jgi:hypothetical protein
VTGFSAPWTPVTAALYIRYRWPWFKVWDADNEALAVSAALAGIKSVGAVDALCTHAGAGAEAARCAAIAAGAGAAAAVTAATAALYAAGPLARSLDGQRYTLEVCPVCMELLANVRLSGCTHSVCLSCFPKLSTATAAGAPSAGTAGKVGGRTGAADISGASLFAHAGGVLAAHGRCPLCVRVYTSGTVVAAQMGCEEVEAAMACEPQLVVCFSSEELLARKGGASGEGSCAATTSGGLTGIVTAATRICRSVAQSLSQCLSLALQ